MPNVDVRAEFRPTADKHRKLRPFYLALLLGAVAAQFYYMPRNPLVGFCIFFSILVLGGLLEPALNCPACKKNLKDSPISFCPKCGGDSLARRNWTGALLCQGCSSTLYFRGGRGKYSVRFCPHCGGHVDDRGI
jgi:Zn-finger nucleic acid-binding protein